VSASGGLGALAGTSFSAVVTTSSPESRMSAFSFCARTSMGRSAKPGASSISSSRASRSSSRTSYSSRSPSDSSQRRRVIAFVTRRLWISTGEGSVMDTCAA
jgi:hypothetical protein